MSVDPSRRPKLTLKRDQNSPPAPDLRPSRGLRTRNQRQHDARTLDAVRRLLSESASRLLHAGAMLEEIGIAADTLSDLANRVESIDTLVARSRESADRIAEYPKGRTAQQSESQT